MPRRRSPQPARRREVAEGRAGGVGPRGIEGRPFVRNGQQGAEEYVSTLRERSEHGPNGPGRPREERGQRANEE